MPVAFRELEKSMASLEGRTLDRYVVRELIGRGGMADVYLGYDPRFERDIAVKIFKRGEDEDLLQRFVREARLMASLHNSHLIPVYDTGEVDLDGFIQYYIVMPYMPGGTLRDRTRNKPLSLAEACRCLNEIADALDYIHARGIIHRDIKSSNVLLDSEGRCYLADFGIARNSSEATQMTSTGNVLGTVDYIAPELFESDHKADVRSDLYSLGVLLFEMVTGQLPFKAENPLAVVTMHMTKQPPSPRNFVPTLPPQVERVILKALEKNPALRYGRASELAHVFCQAASGRAMGAEKTGSAAWGNDIAGASTVYAQPQPPLVLPPTEGSRRTPIQPQTTGAYGGRTAQTRQRSGYYAPPPQSTYPPQYPPAQEPGTPHTRGRIVTIIALITLLAVIGPMLYILLMNQHSAGITAPTATTIGSGAQPSATLNPTVTPNTTATAQAIAAATATQQAYATSTAVAGATATVQAQAAATAGVVQTATAGQATYKDTLTDANNAASQTEQWDQGKRCTFQGDGYHVSSAAGFLGASGFSGCREAGAQYTNATFSVDLVINSGHSGGLFFYVNPTAFGAYAGYLFEVDTQGNYRVSRSSDFSTGNNTILQDWTGSSALKTGIGVKNRLQVIARNGNLLFYINGTFVNQQSDNAFTSGGIAFLATTVQGGQNANVTYSNVAVYQ